jgi:alpha-tubulin suppressor-like RCC1 family protein
MQESEKIPLDNVIVSDGINKYDTDQIYSNPKIRTLVNNAIYLGGFTNIIKQINDENGTVYITTDSDFSTWKADLKNVSIYLLDLWNQNRP